MQQVYASRVFPIAVALAAVRCLILKSRSSGGQCVKTKQAYWIIGLIASSVTFLNLPNSIVVSRVESSEINRHNPVSQKQTLRVSVHKISHKHVNTKQYTFQQAIAWEPDPKQFYNGLCYMYGYLNPENEMFIPEYSAENG